MAGRLDYECNNGHVFEAEGNKSRRRCPTCRSVSEIIWLSPRSPHRQLQTPIVMWRYPDGSLGVAGGADSKTPRGAERVEIRSIGEYRKHVKDLNKQFLSKEQLREEKYMEAKENLEREGRSNLAWAMGQESDPVARDIYREALEYNKGGHERLPFSEYFSIAMEMYKSNYE